MHRADELTEAAEHLSHYLVSGGMCCDTSSGRFRHWASLLCKTTARRRRDRPCNDCLLIDGPQRQLRNKAVEYPRCSTHMNSFIRVDRSIADLVKVTQLQSGAYQGRLECCMGSRHRTIHCRRVLTW